MGRRNSTRVDEGGKNGLNEVLTLNMKGANRSGEGGRRARYVTPDLSYDKEGAGEGRAKII